METVKNLILTIQNPKIHVEFGCPPLKKNQHGQSIHSIFDFSVLTQIENVKLIITWLQQISSFINCVIWLNLWVTVSYISFYMLTQFSPFTLKGQLKYEFKHIGFVCTHIYYEGFLGPLQGGK